VSILKKRIFLLLAGIILLSIISIQFARNDSFNAYITENNLWTTYKENKLLKKRIANLEQLKVDKQVIVSENKLLTDIKLLMKEYKDYNPIVATVISRDLDLNNPQNWYNSLVIDKGHEDQIIENMPVLTSEGLIGSVNSVTDHTAEIQLLTSMSRKNLVPATIENDQSVTGMLENYDFENNQLLFTKIDINKEIKIGSIVTTSNLSSYFPSQLKIGEVIEVKKDNYGLTNTAIVKPAANFYDISYVVILQNT
jgi:rod shape-determining protein MreC